MDNTPDRMMPADALVVFGASGDLAHKMIFPALYALAKRKVLDVPVVGVARSKWSLPQLHEHVKDSLEQAGGIDDPEAFDRLLSLLRYVSGDYGDLATFRALKQALRGARHIILPFPPSLSRQ